MKIKGYFFRNHMLAEYIGERYSQEVELELDISSKKEISLANLLASDMAEESVLYKMYKRDYITVAYYKNRLSIMIDEISSIYNQIENDITDLTFKSLVAGFIYRNKQASNE